MEKEDKQQLNITDSVMSEINEGHVKMRPKFYFVLGMLALASGLILTIIIGVWFTGIASYHLRHHDPLSFITLGQHGWNAFLRTFPFIPLLLALTAVGIGIWLIRKYEISYKHSFLGIILSVVFAVIAAGYVVDALGINEQLVKVSPMKMWYMDKSMGDEWLICEVEEESFDDQVLMCKASDGELVEVDWDDSTMLPLGMNLDKGDVVRIVGEWDGNVFIASGIRKGRRIPMHCLDDVSPMPGPSGKTKGWRLSPHPYR